MARGIAGDRPSSWPKPGEKIRSYHHGLAQLGAGRLMLGVGFVDVAVITGSVHLAVLSRFGNPFVNWSAVRPFEVYTGATTFTIASCVASMFLFELYSTRDIQRMSTIVARLVMALLSTAALMSIVSYWLPSWRIFRGMQLYFSAYALGGLVVWRWVARKAVTKWVPNSKVIMVGSDSHIKRLSEVIAAHPICRLEVGGSLSQESIGLDGGSETAVDLLELARNNEAVAVIASFESTPSETVLRELLRCKSAGLRVIDGPSMYKKVTGRVPINLISTSWLAFGPDFDLSGNIQSRVAQRLMDVILSVVGLVLATPLMLCAAVLIKLTSNGPVLFRQERVGENERLYELVKFRTMRTDAEEAGPQRATEHDSRLTPIGGFLRATRIDELPQLWTVLKGDMSFIGPRPERELFVAQLRSQIRYYGLRFTVKPGLTGWAQVNYGYGSTTEDAATKLEYDLYYIQEMSPFLNLLILLRTVSTVLFRRGTCMSAAVTFVTQFFDPDPSATSYYLSDIAYELAARGFAVTVVTAQPSREHGLAVCPALERRNGVLIHRLELAAYDREAIASRVAAQMRFTAAAAGVLRSQSEKSVVVAVTCPPFLVWLGYLCVLLRRRFVPLIHDVYPQIAVVVEKLPASIAPLWEAVERGALRTSSAVWVLGRCQAEVMRPRLPTNLRQSISIIPHWAKAQVEESPGHKRQHHPLLRSMNIQQKFVVQYSGNFGPFHGLDILPGVIEKSDPQHVHFRIVGGGQMREWLQEEAQRRGLKHVTFLPRQPDSEFANVLSACDAALVCLHPAAAGLCVPSKLYGILASGRPVIAVTAREAEAARVVSEFDCGVVVDTHRAEDVAAAIGSLAKDPARAVAMGRNAANAYREHFTRRKALDAYEAALKAVVASSED